MFARSTSPRCKLFALLIAVVSMSATACKTIPSTPSFDPSEPATHSGFCSDLSDSANAVSTRYNVAGWVTALAGAGSIAVGAIIGPKSDAGNVFAENRGLLLSMGGLSLVPVSVYSFLRSNEAARTAGAANNSLKLFPMRTAEGPAQERKKLQYDMCVAAKSSLMNRGLGGNELPGTMAEYHQKRIVDFQERALRMQRQVLESQARALEKYSGGEIPERPSSTVSETENLPAASPASSENEEAKDDSTDADGSGDD